jgi:hypothetical protein
MEFKLPYVLAMTLDIGALLQRLGPATTFPDLRRRLRCTACGSRKTHLMHGWDG